MIKSVMIRQATKAGCIEWQVGGGGRSIISYIKNKKRKGARKWKHLPYTDGKQPRYMEIGGR